MTPIDKIIATIDAEIAVLEHARNILTGSQPQATPGKHNLTTEGRKRISEAVRRRWKLHHSQKVA